MALVRNDISDIEYYLSTQATSMHVHVANTVLAVICSDWFGGEFDHVPLSQRENFKKQQDRIIAFIRDMIPMIDFVRLRTYYYNREYKRRSKMKKIFTILCLCLCGLMLGCTVESKLPFKLSVGMDIDLAERMVVPLLGPATSRLADRLIWKNNTGYPKSEFIIFYTDKKIEQILDKKTWLGKDSDKAILYPLSMRSPDWIEMGVYDIHDLNSWPKDTGYVEQLKNVKDSFIKYEEHVHHLVNAASTIRVITVEADVANGEFLAIGT